MSAPTEPAPQRLLILGTDAAGKNHVGRLIWRRWRAAGLAPGFRERWLSAGDQGEHDRDKGAGGHLAEAAFLAVYPLLGSLIPALVRALIARDLRRLRQRADCDIVVSHTALRLAAFHLGHTALPAEQIPVPAGIAQSLERLRERHDGAVVVLDISHATRRARVGGRGEDADPFDRYLAADPALSERIEDVMVRLAREHLGAALVVNDAPGEAALAAQLSAIGCWR